MKHLIQRTIRTLVLLGVAGYATAQAEPARETPATAELYLGGGLVHDPLQPPTQRSIALTKAQQEKLFAIFRTEDSALSQHTQTLQDAQEAMRKLAASSDYSEEKARALAEVVAQATAEIAFLLNKGDHQIFEVLTPAQRQQATSAFRHTAATAAARKPKI